MDVVEKLYSGYGEHSGGGMRAVIRMKCLPEATRIWMTSFQSWTSCCTQLSSLIDGFPILIEEVYPCPRQPTHSETQCEGGRSTTYSIVGRP